jgi:hypothetical protein
LRKIYRKYLSKIEDMTKNFDPSEPLPPELLVSSAGSHLYRIGLSHFRFGWKKNSQTFDYSFT